MLTKRLIACFDVVAGRVTKAVRFEDNIDVAPECYEAAAVAPTARAEELDLDAWRRLAACATSN